MPPFDPSLRILGGLAAKPNEFPYEVNLRIDGANICGGAIINTLLVLTAAHCVINLKTKIHKIQIHAGDYNVREFEGSEQIIKVKDIIPHEKYKSDELAHDIAILVLSKPLVFNKFVQNIPYPLSKTIFKGNATLTGWGKTSANSPHSAFLRKVNIPMISHDNCKNILGDLYSKGMICAGEKGKDACKGDSGGPLSCIDESTSKLVLCGIVSFGENTACNTAHDYPGVYTDISYYAKWIHKKISPLLPTKETDLCQNRNNFPCRGDPAHCIHSDWVCDGDKDCDEGEDEVNCCPENHHFHCYIKPRKCIRNSLICNGEKDCDGGEDEVNCCTRDEFHCQSPPGQCIFSSWTCDGYNDCSNGEDEINCDGNDLSYEEEDVTTTMKNVVTKRNTILGHFYFKTFMTLIKRISLKQIKSYGFSL